MEESKLDIYADRKHSHSREHEDGNLLSRASALGFHRSSHERDACGLGIVADLHGKPTHSIIMDSLTVLCSLEHRGAVGGDRKTGDGAGILCQIPDRFFRQEMDLDRLLSPLEGQDRHEDLPYGIGMFFLPNRPEAFIQAKTMVERVAEKESVELLAWRDVPVRPQVLGARASKSMPRICQAAFICRDSEASLIHGNDLERRLYVLRKCLESEAKSLGFSIDNFYMPSCSSRTIVYKGMFVASQFSSFYPDLNRDSFESAFAVVHQRYSTNTFPSWPLAQPFRMISHNGEINTLRKNINAMRARQATMKSSIFGEEFVKLMPVIEEAGSDSAMFDNVYELLYQAGRSLEHAFMMMVPEPFSSDFGISRDKKAFYEYHAALMEGWDGPAAMTFTDGLRVGAALDRNGLRPFRYAVTRSGRFMGASEAGVLAHPESDVMEKGILRPGHMLLVDRTLGRLVKDREIKSRICRSKPYRRWIEGNKIDPRGLFSAANLEGFAGGAVMDVGRQAAALRYFGYDKDTLQILKPMMLTGQEPVSAMGTRKPPCALSRVPVLLYSYFHQLFAQVTNPPIDPYRENLVMSLENYIGRQKNLLEETPAHCRQLKLLHPLLSNADIARLRKADLEDFRVATVSMLFPVSGLSDKGSIKGSMLEAALARICADAERLIDEGMSLLVLSDRGVDESQAAVPALLVVSALHAHLVGVKKRHMAGLVVETGEAREVHHIAVLLAYGASGINPWMVFENISVLYEAFAAKETSRIDSLADNYIEAVKKGILKILSKLGISTISSYRGARLYETVGLAEDFASRYFRGTEARFGGIGIQELEADVLENHARAFLKSEVGSFESLCDAGTGVVNNGVAKANNSAREIPWPPSLAACLTKAVRDGDTTAWREYTEGMEDPERQPFALRDLFAFKKCEAIPLGEVQKASEIVGRFSVAAMSCGAISVEAHEALAAGANSVGAWSNSGEGGEDDSRCSYRDLGYDSRSASRQVASARFGVTAEYVAHAKELQIKIAQGAKPGEGGQLPGPKVDAYIARLRHATPGKTLISPPPHHDIYSIEDLSQLIHDLRCVNPDARIAVKLAAQAGIGAVAAGVAKAGADCVIVSSGDGGTGAAPLSSLDYTGNTWEAALPEIRQVLAMNGLDANIVVQVDGRLRGARDVVIAAILGAREFAFGTIALFAMGCVACGQCNLGRCPVGIATQDAELRRKFKGRPEHIASLFLAIANDVRSILSSLGVRSLDEVAGRWEFVDFLGRARLPREKLLRFDRIVQALEVSRRYPIDEEGDTDGSGPPLIPLPKAGLLEFDARHRLQASIPEIDAQLIQKCSATIRGGGRIDLEMAIRNSDRSTGAALSGEIIRTRKESAQYSINVEFTGSAGQSFGAFLVEGVNFRLSGEANDYVGKGLSGGSIVIYPRVESEFSPETNVIAGNVCLFGATSGEAFFNGLVGERFCVRNSGALAVVEGTGDHACEYMTGGTVVVLGRTGVNFGAGMSGGIAYVLDEDQLFDTRCNPSDVDLEVLNLPADIVLLKSIIGKHHARTASPRAKRILTGWDDYYPLFLKVSPR
jgi:glutamate synthase domain-containing protein 2/glutamate synthase domain-containing protein 1/glutamate synthase domain-containing protein 3